MPGPEALQSYQNALKQGQKEYKNCVHRGQYPYIQALSGQERSGLSQVSLGDMEIPMYLIVGSTEDQRTTAFSPSFYPLMGADTEFAAKWMNLYEAQMDEGSICTPFM